MNDATRKRLTDEQWKRLEKLSTGRFRTMMEEREYQGLLDKTMPFSTDRVCARIAEAMDSNPPTF